MADSIDQQFVEYIVKSLVGNPDAVSVTRSIDEKGVLLQLTVDPSDLGRVIGRGGATAKSIRTLLRALGVKNDARYNLKVVDTNAGAPMSPPTTQDDTVIPRDDVQVEAEAETAATREEPVEEPAHGPESGPEAGDDTVSRHREDIKEFTDLDL